MESETATSEGPESQSFARPLRGGQVHEPTLHAQMIGPDDGDPPGTTAALDERTRPAVFLRERVSLNALPKGNSVRSHSISGMRRLHVLESSPSASAAAFSEL